MPDNPDQERGLRRVTVSEGGPLLVDGPVEVTGPDGATAVSHRFVVAICVCRRSRTPPWCDTSHRRRSGGRTAAEPPPGPPGDG